MSKRKIILLLLTVFLLCGCTSTNNPQKPEIKNYEVEYYDYFGNLIQQDIIPTVDDFNSFIPSSISTENRTLEFYNWKLEIDEKNKKIIANGLYTDSLKPTEIKYTNLEVFKNSLLPNEVNHILVFYVSFKGEPELDRKAFEDLFVGENQQNSCLQSINSYYKYNSNGNELFDFTFVYYQSSMSVEEAYHYVNDLDSKGNFVGNRFIFNIFDEAKKKGLIDTKKLDADKDGFVDASIFVMGDHLIDGTYLIYGGAQGHTSSFEYPANVKSPTLGNYIKVSNYFLSQPLQPASSNHEGARTLIHEFGHLFGLSDYYDTNPYRGEVIDVLGYFDMQSYEVGDWNPYSKLTCGWLKPYVISEDIDSVTLKLRCSSTYNEAILIPTSKGWNSTAFDEYLLVEVMAPEGANGYDWSILTEESERRDHRIYNKDGGVRILHIDARLLTHPDDKLKRIDNIDEAIKGKKALRYAYSCSNGYEPYFSNDSNFYHIIDWIPKNGTSQFRINTPTTYSTLMLACTNDLFSENDVFSIATHKAAFVNGETANNGGTFDYQIKVDYYNAKEKEAIITITKNK